MGQRGPITLSSAFADEFSQINEPVSWVVQAGSPISRLNFFSHAKTGLIAIEGEIQDDGSNVTLSSSGKEGGWTQIISGKPGPIVDLCGDLGHFR